MRRVEDREIAEQQRPDSPVTLVSIGAREAAGDGESGQRLRVGAERKRDSRRAATGQQQQARHQAAGR